MTPQNEAVRDEAVSAMTDCERITLELAKRELARRSYGEYLAYTGGRRWVETRMSRYIAVQVEKFLAKPGYGVLLIEAPPQHGKSACLTEALPAWYLGKNPAGSVIIASYSDESAERFMRQCRKRVECFGAVLFSDGVASASKSELVTDAGGRCISRGIRAGITGNPADLIIIDDPVKNRAQADSEIFRRGIWEEWISSLKTRLSAKGKVLIIMTPWHCDDLAARILKTEPDAELIRLPVQAEKDDPLGRAEGQALCPELGKDEAWLEKFRQGFISDPHGGKRAWEALFMCRPRTDDGGTVKREWWRFYSQSAGERPQMHQVLISVDAAFKGGENSDYVAVTVWGRTERDFYLLYCLNRRMDFPETLRAVRAVKALYPDAGAVLIEDKANGSAIISVLQREMFCIPVEPRGGKEARAAAAAPAIESGHVFLPSDAPWVDDYIEQWAQFPRGAHDDMVDSTSQAITYMLMSGYTAADDAAAPDAGIQWLESGIYGVYRQ